MSEGTDLRLGVYFRKTPLGPGEFPPCDGSCWRWQGVAHIHVKTNGLDDDDSPEFSIEAWCSCGAAISTVDVDVGGLLVDADAFGRTIDEESTKQFGMFVKHMVAVHGIDPETDSDWRRRLATPP